MRVLVTGAAGFIGSHLADHLARRGNEVWGTYLQETSPPDGVSGVELDILDRRRVVELFHRFRPEAVVHLAGLSHVGGSWSDLTGYYQVNVVGAENVLEAAAGCRVLVASSAEVYGAVPEGEQPIGEDREPAPASPYAMTKASLERIALPRGSIAVRSFNVIGPGQSSDFALPAFAAQLAAIHHGRQEPVLRVGNLEARRDFIAVDDAVAAYALLLDRGVEGEVYNLGSGQALSIAEALHRLIDVSGVRARIEVDPERFRPADIPLLCADSDRLRNLGWAPAKTIDQALEQLWRSVADAV